MNIELSGANGLTPEQVERVVSSAARWAALTTIVQWVCGATVLSILIYTCVVSS